MVTTNQQTASTTQTAYQQTGKTPVGAFYLHKKPYEEEIPNAEDVQGIKYDISRALSNMKTNLAGGLNDIKHQLTDFDPMEFAKNLAIQSPSKYVMKYATAAMVILAEGRAIKSETVLDLLCLHFAPQLHQTAIFMGYNSVSQIRHALKNRSGDFNVVGFLRGFNYGMQTLQDEKRIQYYAKQFEDELPIDLIESCTFSYGNKVFDHKINFDGFAKLIANGARDVEINLVAHVKNKYGDFSKSNDYVHKLENCMMKSENLKQENSNNTTDVGLITLRVGKDIYENCILTDLSAEVTSNNSSVYDMKITAKLLYNIFEGLYSENSMMYDGITILNPNPFDIGGLRGNFETFYENFV